MTGTSLASLLLRVEVGPLGQGHRRAAAGPQRLQAALHRRGGRVTVPRAGPGPGPDGHRLQPVLQFGVVGPAEALPPVGRDAASPPALLLQHGAAGSASATVPRSPTISPRMS